jgi:signal transduction histidine kinase
VFSNLLTNAIRFAARDSEIVVRARAEAGASEVGSHRAPAAARIRFEVADQGRGVAVAHQAGLFEQAATFWFTVPVVAPAA